MIAAVLSANWLTYRRDPMALAMSIVLPLVFFAVFASVFSNFDGAGNRINVALVAQGDGEFASALLNDLGQRSELRVVHQSSGDPQAADEAGRLIRSGAASVAVVLAADFDTALEDEEPGSIQLLVDAAHPIAVGVVQGLLQAAFVAVGYDTVAEDADNELLAIDVVDLLGGEGKRPSIAFFAAGLGVMFLMFFLNGRAALVLDERSNGIVHRLGASGVSPIKLAAGRWLFLALMGTAQVTLMFVFAAVVFGLDLWNPRTLLAFALLTAVTATTAAAFAQLLAEACRTREQLAAFSTISVLVLALVGGNLFPRFLMPESMQAIGRLAFNGWALDGYQKVFWYDARVDQLGGELAVLLGFACTFMALTLVIAQRRARR